jgi:hypothetical protein
MFGLLEPVAFWPNISDFVPYLILNVAEPGEQVILPVMVSVTFHPSPNLENLYESFATATILPGDP